MQKIKMYQDSLSAVSEETEVEEEHILSNSKQEEIVDARSILMKILTDQGFYPIQISHFTGIGVRSVNGFLQGFRARCNSRKIMRINYENVRNNLGIT